MQNRVENKDWKIIRVALRSKIADFIRRLVRELSPPSSHETLTTTAVLPARSRERSQL